MALQIRLRHSLGERTYALPARSADRPVTVGRSAQADLQIPSIHAAPVHCVLFVHDGKWVVQDAGGTTGTLVNGRLISQPTVVKVGDTVTLGSEPNPPTMTVVATTAPAAHKPRLAAVAVAAPAEAAAPEAPASLAAEDVADVDDAVDLGAAAARYRSDKFYVPHGPRLSETALAAGIVVAVVLVALIGLMIYKLRDNAAAQTSIVTVKPTAQPNAAPAAPRVIVINPPLPRVQPQAHPQAAPAREAPRAEQIDPGPAPLPASAPAAAPAPTKPDPRQQDADWQRVEEAHKFMAPQGALVVFEDYRQSRPNPGNAADLQRYTDEALDLLWWQRIRSLCDDRDIVLEDLKKLDRDIAVENNAEYRRKMIADRSNLQARKKQIEESLAKEHAFAQKDPPDLYDADKLAALRKQRNAALYANFTKAVMESIRKTRKAPWAER